MEGVWVVTPELHPSVLTLCYLMTFLKFLILPPVAWPLWLWDIEGGRLQEHMELIPALRAVQFTVLTVLSNKLNWLSAAHTPVQWRANESCILSQTKLLLHAGLFYY